MAFLLKLFKGAAKHKREYPNIRQGTDPLEQWQKIGELGDGSFGKVFKAEHRNSGKLAALKRVPIQEESELDDFMVEIDILAECKHPNIVKLYEAFFYDQALWIFIEFCAGGAVDDIIVDLDHGLSEPQIRCISKQMFDALAFLHDRGCIHRDIKAGNILLCQNGTIRLADFGVSAITTKNKQKRDTFIGTPYWMAPEVIICETIKDEPYDCKADVWSAGITLIELADMNPPFHEMSPMRVVLKITKSEPATLMAPSRWSKDFNSFLSMCLKKDPSVRSSAADLLSHPFIEGVTDFRPLRVLYQERRAEVVEVVEDLPEDADIMHREIQHVEETFSIPESSTPSSEAPSTSILPSDGIISPMSTVSPELGPSPTAVFSPEPTTAVSPEPVPESVPETTSGTSSNHTSTAFASSGLGPEPTVVRSASPVSLGPEPVSLSSEPGSNRASPGPEPVPLPLEPIRTAEEEEEEEEEAEEEEEEAIVPLSSEPIHTEDKTVKEEEQERKEEEQERKEEEQERKEEGQERKEEGQERKEDKEERRKKVKEGRKGKEGRKERRKEEEDEVAAKPPAAQVEEQKPSSSDASSSPGSTTRGSSLVEDNKEEGKDYKYATLSRMRKFRVDGQVFHSKTVKIVDVKGNRTLRDNKRYQEMRKVDFRELKRLQREEMKEGSEFYARIKIEKDIQEKKFEAEQQELEKRFDVELEVLEKRQKKETEKLEVLQINQFRIKSKQLKADQSKEQKRYKESQKEDEKQMLKRLESTLPKSTKKQEISRAKSEMQVKRQDKDRRFMTLQSEHFESELRRLLEQHKEEMKNLELRFLDAKQDLKRTRTNAVWEMEQRHKQDRHQQLKQQVREAFHMQRHQMHVRHQKEVELQARRDQFRLEELRQQHLLEKRQLPKRLKADHKLQVAEARKAARNKKDESSKEKLRKLDEQYVKRSQLETELMNEKHEKELEMLKAELEANMRELQDIQNEKKMQLTQQETNKIKERDEQHTQELREWRSEIAKKKQKLEDEFHKERTQQEMFYVHRPPMMRSSSSASNAMELTSDRTEKAKSVALDYIRAGSVEGKSSPPLKRTSLQNLDDVVLGQPPLSRPNSIPNGNNS